MRSTISLAHELGLEVVAEGIEDQPTWDLLTKLGCDTAQGYLYGRPSPAGATAVLGRPSDNPSELAEATATRAG